MWWTVVIPALLLGIVSSTHCVGMCGPLALALPLQRFPHIVDKGIALLLYNAGRISAYMTLGVLAGWLGRSIFVPVWQHWLAIVSGTFIILFAGLRLLGQARVQSSFLAVLYTPLYRLITWCMNRHKLGALYLLGIGNGLLPCGLAYIAAVMSVTTGSVIKGVLFMGLYGAGTTPAMFLLSVTGMTVSLPVRNALKRITPFLAFVAGILIVLKGFNVQVPFISNWLPEHKQGAMCRPLN